jgi:hypothetical protein
MVLCMHPQVGGQGSDDFTTAVVLTLLQVYVLTLITL